MKLTKGRLSKLLLKDKQTRKKYKSRQFLTHTNTYKNRSCHNSNTNTNSKNMTIKNITI